MASRSLPPRPRRAAVSLLAFLLLFALLISPVAALVRLTRIFDPIYVVGYAILISVVTFCCYRHDKHRAQSGERRTPESALHLTEFLGGWPGAFLAQRIFRHKIVKIRYQLAFWCIVACHEFAAFDFVQDWRYAKRLFLFLP